MIELVAEVSTNHGGSLKIAKEFIKAYAPVVNTMKFQFHRVKHLSRLDPQFEWMARSELAYSDYQELQQVCEGEGVGFLLTAYHPEEVPQVRDLGCRRIKVGSGEAGSQPLARAIAEAGLQPIVSCGLVTPRQPSCAFHDEALFLGCVTAYPAPMGMAASVLSQWPYYGWSDHAEGINDLKIAVCLGMQLLEMHVSIRSQVRAPRSFEKGVADLLKLRQFITAYQTAPDLYLKRWTYGDLA